MENEELIKCRDTLLMTNCKMQICGAIQNAYFALGHKDRVVFMDNYEDNISIKEDLLNELNLLIDNKLVEKNQSSMNRIMEKYKKSLEETEELYINNLVKNKEEDKSVYSQKIKNKSNRR